MKTFDRKKLFYTYLLVLVLLAVLPINGTDSSLNNNYIFKIRLDHFAHFTVLLPYFFLLNKRVAFDVITLVLLIWALLFASFTELIQYVIPYRAFNINDLISNWTGILMSVGSFFLYQQGRKRYTSRLIE